MSEYGASDTTKRLADEWQEARDRFLAALADAESGPLAPILSALEHAGQPTLLPIIQRARAVTREAAQLVDLTQLDRGELTVARQAIALRAVVEAGLKATQDTGTNYEYTPIDDSLRVEGDAARLGQVVTALVSFVDSGQTVYLETSRAGAEVVVRIRAADTIAEPHCDGKPTWKPDRSIGLALAERLLDLHGGRFELVDEDGVRNLTARLPALQAETPRHVEEYSERELRIVLVDADSERAGDLELLLRLWGHQIRIVDTEAMAPKAVAAFEPDVVLVDTRLSQDGGFALVQALRKATNPSPMMIGLRPAGQESRAEDGSAPFDQVLQRPLQPVQLRSALSVLS
jgi:CheY-like chemotaxis protein